MSQLTNLEIVDFCDQMAMILKAGISTYEGINIMYDDAKDEASRNILGKMKDSMEEGKPFFEAVAESKIFPRYAANMIKIGEESGRLDDVMEGLSSYYDREESIARAVKNAITYPVIMIIIMAVVIVVLLAKVMPVFEQVFEMLGTHLSGVSKSLMNAGDVLSKYAVVFVIIIAAVVVLVLFFAKSEKGKNVFKNSIGRIGPLRKTYERIAAGRFANGMSLTLKSGLDVDESLQMVRDMSELDSMNAKIDNCRKLMEEGEGFAESLAKSKIFSGMYSRMVVIGFKTGAIDTVMDKIAANYEKENDESISKTISIIEPTIVAVFAVAVGLILLSVMLPLLSVMTGMM